jgi:hypothetical protein
MLSKLFLYAVFLMPVIIGANELEKDKTYSYVEDSYVEEMIASLEDEGKEGYATLISLDDNEGEKLVANEDEDGKEFGILVSFDGEEPKFYAYEDSDEEGKSIFAFVEEESSSFDDEQHLKSIV